jgi:hypothetical protein
MSQRSANFQLEFFLPRDHFKRDEAHEIFSIEESNYFYYYFSGETKSLLQMGQQEKIMTLKMND